MKLAIIAISFDRRYFATSKKALIMQSIVRQRIIIPDNSINEDQNLFFFPIWVRSNAHMYRPKGVLIQSTRSFPNIWK